MAFREWNEFLFVFYRFSYIYENIYDLYYNFKNIVIYKNILQD